MARRHISKRQKYVMYARWRSDESIQEISQDFGLSKNKVKRVLRKYRLKNTTPNYWAKIDKYAKKHGISRDAEFDRRVKIWQRREQKRVSLGIYSGAEPQNFLGVGNNRKHKWRY